MNAMIDKLFKSKWHAHWQYNGVAPMDEIVIWCEATLSKNTFAYLGWEFIDFFDKAAYATFLIRWS